MPRTPLAHYGVLLVLSGVLFFSALGELNLTDRDEGSNAEAPREMLERGDWISPTLNGRPRFAKPVFTYWLIGGSYLVFGVSEFAARFPSALFGTLLVLMHYTFLARIAGRSVAWWSALCLLLNIEMIAIGRLVLTDMVLIFFTTLSLYSFWIASTGRGTAVRWYWVCYAAMGVATLTKGPVGFFVPLLVIAAYLLVTKRLLETIREARLLTGTLVFLLITAPWYLAMVMIHGNTYLESAQANTIGRYLNVIGGHGGTLFFYIPVFFVGFLPWSAFVPSALMQAVREYRAQRSHSREEQSIALFAACWCLVIFFFFTLSATRLPHYIAPLFPAAAVLAGLQIDRLVTSTGRNKASSAFWAILFLGCLFGGTLIAFRSLYALFVVDIAKEFPMAAHVDPGSGIAFIGLCILLGFILMGILGLRGRRPEYAVLAGALTVGLSALLIIHVALPTFDRYFLSPPHVLASTAGKCLEPDEILIVYGRTKPSYVFYARRQVAFAHAGQREVLDSLIEQGKPVTLLTQKRLLSELPEVIRHMPVIEESFDYVLVTSREGRCGA